MRKGLIIALAVMAFVGTQVGIGFAMGIADTGPGCGLGKEVWKNDPHTDNIGKQMLISTTNNPIIPLQAFAITTGTLGCKNSGKVWVVCRRDQHLLPDVVGVRIVFPHLFS